MWNKDGSIPFRKIDKSIWSVETGNTDAVLNGELDIFINEALAKNL